jgi:hypothetical protein
MNRFIFVAEAPEQDSETKLTLERHQRMNRTTQSGYATLLWLWPRIESTHLSRHVTLDAEIMHNGRLVLRREMNVPQVAGLWTARKPFAFDLAIPYEGDLVAVIQARAADGTLDETEEFVIEE